MNPRLAPVAPAAASPPPFAGRPAAPARLQVAFLTGPVSSPSSALSPQQRRFLERLPHDPDIVWIDRDFPYAAGSSAWKATPLWNASLRNAANFLRARSPALTGGPAAKVEKMLGQADHTLFLAGSCGLELLAGLNLPPACLRRISVLAYGPVARRPLPVVAELRVARGSRDFFSVFTRLPTDFAPPCGHLGYLECPEFTAWCGAWIGRHLQRPAHAATF